MKKTISIFLLVAIFLTTIIMTTSCGEVVGCDMCINEDKKSRMHEIEFWGEKIIICDNCYDEMTELADAFK